MLVMTSNRWLEVEKFQLAPQSGYVSNFCGSVDPLIEPVDVYCFQDDSSAPPTLVQGGCPVRIRLELAKRPIIFGCAVIRPENATMPEIANDNPATVESWNWPRVRI